MYYVLFTGSGRESNTANYIRQHLSSEHCTGCFYPQRHMKKKIRGTWTDYYERLIPGYLFVESDDIDALYQELRRHPLLLHVLGRYEQEDTDTLVTFLPLDEKEELWLRRISGLPPKRKPVQSPGETAGGSERTDTGRNPGLYGGISSQNMSGLPVVELSEVGFDENDEVVILSGPLMNLKGQVKKIDLHRRIAKVEVSFMGAQTILHLGIDLVERAGAE